MNTRRVLGLHPSDVGHPQELPITENIYVLGKKEG